MKHPRTALAGLFLAVRPIHDIAALPWKRSAGASLRRVYLSKEKYSLLLFVLISTLLGLFSILYVTRAGICVVTDSSYYLMAAESLVKHHSFATFTPDGEIKPLTVWPPLYPSLLSVSSLISASPASAARWINALLFGLNASLVGLLARKIGRSGILVAAIASALFICSAGMLNIHWVALSEPLFIFLLLICLYALCTYIEKPRIGWLIAAASAAGMAWLTRYSGASFVAAGTIAIVLLSKMNFTRRVRNALLFALIGFAPNLLWMIRNQAVSGGATGKQLGWHPATLSLFQDYLTTLARFVLPQGMILASIATLALLGLSLLLGLGWRRRQLDLSVNGKQKLLLLFAASYAGLLYVSISFLDANLVIDTWRLSLPICLVVLVSAVSLASQLFTSHGKKTALGTKTRWVAAACVLIFLGTFLIKGGEWVSASNSGEPKDMENANFTSRYWTESNLIQALRELPPGTPIYTNGPDALYVLLGQPVYALPQKFSASTRKASGSYDDSLKTVVRQLGDDGVVVYLYTHAFANLPTERELKEKLSLTEVSSDPTGKVFKMVREAQ